MGDTDRYETDGRVATLTLDRPDRYNAIDDDMPGDGRAAVERVDADDSIHGIAIAGAGDVFCSGYDLQRYAETPRPTAWPAILPMASPSMSAARRSTANRRLPNATAAN